MIPFQNINKGNKILHHAYFLEGEKETVFQNLLIFLENEFGFLTQGNPDFWLGDFDNFGVENSRAIKNFQSRKAIAGDKKILVIKTNFITNEAQNALLKIFEEPTKNTHFFLIMLSAETLLPTLKSRLAIIKHSVDLLGAQHLKEQKSPDNQTAKRGLLAKEFLKTGIAKRLELIKVFLPKKTIALNQKSGEKKADKVGAILFLNELEQILHQKFQAGNLTKGGATAEPSPQNQTAAVFAFEEIIKCRSYLNDRSPSVKMILEHLSQVIPFAS